MTESKREVLKCAIRKALVDEVIIYELSATQRPDILVAGCRAIGYCDPEDAAEQTAYLVADAVLSLTHPEAQGNKDLGEPGLRPLVEVLTEAREWIADKSKPTGLGNAFETPAMYSVTIRCWAAMLEKIDAALLQARSAAPTSPQPINGETELESASNGMGLR